MADPRFLLACGNGDHAAGAAWWTGNRGATPEAGRGNWYGWRLTGANNRELGRSAAVYASVAACAENAALVMDGAGDAEADVAADPVTRLWSWRLKLRGRPVALSGRPYQRNRECLYSVTRFLAAAPVAMLCPEPFPVRQPDGNPRRARPILMATALMAVRR